MGQYEVFKWLKEQYEIGNNQWFTVQEVEKGLRNKGIIEGLKYTRTHLIKLSINNCIAIKDLDKTGLNNYKRVFKYEIKKRNNDL